MFDRVEKIRELGVGPLGPTEPREVVLEFFGEFEKVANVVESVAKLRGAQGTPPPIGSGFASKHGDLEGLREQVTQRKGIRISHETRRDLDVKEPLRRLARLKAADPQVFTRGMHHDLHLGVVHKGPEPSEVGNL